MDKVLIIIDMQNDFITGALGTPEAKRIVPKVVDYLNNYEGKVIFTRDTHYKNYLNTLEGTKLPITHCIRDTWGWEICDELKPYAEKIINKETFGFSDWEYLLNVNTTRKTAPDEIAICGLCTDICVISNALILRAAYPNVRIYVHKDMCAGVTPELHEQALEVMKSCQIDVI